MYLTSEKKAELFAKYGNDAKNTGSAESQIALFTFRINHLTEHSVTARSSKSWVFVSDWFPVIGYRLREKGVHRTLFFIFICVYDFFFVILCPNNYD